jgi:REG-2-like HAD superfamily hydrolase
LARTRALLFDAGATLFRERSSRAAIYAEVARRHGLRFEEAAVAAAMQAVHAELPREIDGAFRYSRPWFERFIVEVFGKLGARPLPPELPAELFARWRSAATFRLFDDVVPTLDELGRRGLALAVLSNWSDTLPELLEGLGIAGRFRAVVVSSIERLEKPDPALFGRALARLGAAPEETLHVGDRPREDVEGAQSARIAAVLLDRDGAHPEFRGARIASLAELPRLLDVGTNPGRLA